jgi:hypothetical protein
LRGIDLRGGRSAREERSGHGDHQQSHHRLERGGAPDPPERSAQPPEGAGPHIRFRSVGGPFAVAG